MSHLLAEWIHTGIMIFVAALVLRFYFKPEVKYLYKKKWVPYACLVLLLYSVVKIGIAYHEYAATRVLAPAELEKVFLANHTLAETDLVHRSPRGYCLLVPKGYEYASVPSGGVSLIAVRGETTIVVIEHADSNPLDKAVQDTCRDLKRKNPTYSFSAPEWVQVGKSASFRLAGEVTKDKVPLRGMLLFTRNDSQLFVVMCWCPAALFEESKDQFKRVIGSLTID